MRIRCFPSPAVATVVTVAAAMAFPDSLAAQFAFRSQPGVTTGEQLGSAIAAVGDVDGDGVTDYLASAPKNSYVQQIVHRGAVHLDSGRTGNTLAILLGQRSGTQLGETLAGLGDVDGDGVPDFAIGAPNDSSRVSGGGFVTVYSGATRKSLWTYAGTSTYEQVGRALASMGDVDGDGAPDLAVTCRRVNGSDDTEVRVLSGRSGTVLKTLFGSTDAFGHALANAGDIDGDGRDDLVVGSYAEPASGYFQAGTVTAYAAGNSLGVLWSAGGTRASQWLGVAVASAGDVDGDGTPDVLVGAAAEAYVLSGRNGARQQRILSPLQSSAGFGVAVAGAGDMTGDGVPDLAIGDPNYASNAGRVNVFDGADGSIVFQYSGTSGDGIGFAFAALGDVAGPRGVDLAVGVPMADDGGTDAGRVDVVTVGSPGYTQPFGTSCPSSFGVPNLSAGSSSTLLPGGTVDLDGGIYSRTTPVLLMIGQSNTSWNGTPLPLWLLGLGAPACHLYISPEVVAPTLTKPLIGNLYVWKQTLTLGSTRNFYGATFYFQLAIPDGNAPGGAAFSNGLEVRIGG